MSNSEPSASVLHGIPDIGGLYISFDSNGENCGWPTLEASMREGESTTYEILDQGLIGVRKSAKKDQAEQSDNLPTPRGIASVKVMRIPCSGRKITMGRASMVWPGTRQKSYFLSRTLRTMSICSMA